MVADRIASLSCTGTSHDKCKLTCKIFICKWSVVSHANIYIYIYIYICLTFENENASVATHVQLPNK